MGYALLWIEWLGTTLLVTAFLLAVTTRFRRFGRTRLSIILVLLFLLVYGLPTAYAAFLRYGLGIVNFSLGFFASLTIVAVVGVVALLIVGWRRRLGDSPRRAATWSRSRLALAAGVVLALEVMTFWNLDMEVKARLSALRAESGALALSVAPARVPDSQNAALLYRRAFGMLPDKPKGPDVWPEAWRKATEEGDYLTPEVLNDPTIAAFLERQQSTLVLLRRAAGMPGCYFEHDYGEPRITELFLELGSWRRMARLLELDARYQATHGHGTLALRDVHAMFAMSRHVGAEATLLSQLVAIAVDVLAKKTLEAVLAVGPLSTDDLNAVSLDDSTPLVQEMQRAFAMEEAYGMALFCDFGGPHGLTRVAEFQKSTVGQPPPMFPLPAPYRVFFLSADVEGYHDLMRMYRSVAALPYTQAQQELGSLDTRESRFSRGLFTGIIAPALGAALRQSVAGEAGHGTAVAGLALARYHAVHQKYPDKLDDLVPEFLPAVPQDPFDGQPLRYHTTPQEVVVYSIGPDLKDDQGTPIDWSKKTGDITFRLKR